MRNRALCLISLFLAGAVAVPAATLDSSVDLDASPALSLQGSTQNVQTNGAGFYDFGDKNGDGTRTDAVTPAGLNMGNFSLFTDDANSAAIRLDLNGGNLVSTNGSIKTETYRASGNILIYNVGSVSMGNGILSTRTTATTMGGTPKGTIEVGQPGNRAGSIQVAGLYTCGAQGLSGSVKIHSSGDVLIQTAAGVATNIDVSTMDNYPINTGFVDIRHDGSFVARTIDATSVRFDPLGDLSWNGDALGNGPSGSFSATAIDTYDPSTLGAYSKRTAHVSISNYLSVTVGSVDTHMQNGGVGNQAGSLVITNISVNIVITGSLNLNGQVDGTDGNLTLQAGGTITLGDLDLNSMGLAAFNSGIGRTHLTGILSNFTGANDASLLTPAGQKIYYEAGQNPGLNGQAYQLRDLSGTAGAGGELAPRPLPAGMVFRFR